MDPISTYGHTLQPRQVAPQIARLMSRPKKLLPSLASLAIGRERFKGMHDRTLQPAELRRQTVTIFSTML